MKIAVALSGGVDSSVAAMLLDAEGHEIAGITMSVYREGSIDTASCGNACYGPDEADDIEAAKSLCARLGIPFHLFDCAEEYEEVVLGYFKSEYRRGRTPNPCVRCNHQIKLGLLPALAAEGGLEFDKIATGHYARVEQDSKTGRYYLRQAMDVKKDQSYFLYRLNQQQLSRLIFPLGNLRKKMVLDIAASNGMKVDDYRESQDFIAGDYKQLFRGHESGGEIVDADGRILGKHSGLWNYTIGQRRGIGIASDKPLYVIELDSESNRVVVGPKDRLRGDSFRVSDLVWMKLGDNQTEFSADVRIRSNSRAVPAEITVDKTGKSLFVGTMSELNAITPGQSAVFYDSEGAVLCGGIIE